MSQDPWSDRIAGAEDDATRRTLLGEISLWRAGRLTDIVAARQATFAISRLHWLLREKDRAEQEARQLLSLCQTPPRASGEELDAAKGWLRTLGAPVPKVVQPPRSREERGRKGKERNERSPRGERNDRNKGEKPARNQGPGLVEQAVAAASSGKWTEALGQLRGKKGGRAELARVWIHLARALANEDAASRQASLEQLAGRLHDKLTGAGASEPEAKPAREPKPRAEKAEKPARKDEKPAEAKPAEPKGPSPRELARQRDDALKAALTADPAPQADAIVPLLEGYKRLWRAIASAERWNLDDARMEQLLIAVDRASDDAHQIPGGTSLAVRRAATGADGFATLLTTAPTAARYGGAGIDVVVDLARAAAADGWEVDRVLRGPTRKEVGRHAVLGTVESSLDGLWRVLVKKGERHAELWYVAALPPEGRAGVPMLLLEEHPRVVVLPIDPELLGWYGALEAPEAIGWTGDEGDAVREALTALG